ncbi:MAG: tRNA (adenosine(37)-N6)-threonylcarbamoyltransferase complex dimerization subunit type 1 TsaB [Cyclobacteriaceae bacterium]|jgi:tRNA threonylcarbamoyladenosine biosynthesis protein TsaB|nr:tRNA (adenosine(37)-N6)-threonylcarbamoyltransferase complex dimerization subunit type 1 TsaB [Cyclobacteriaceae bacterium]MDH4298321.1 tRNA (adenosine(37)-N6)-threonylcarbamoyltransferase complex dimerization subunit type 1 TsaB [Cyclobacteriaceae bacterium]MDH5251438.1 tRNA (adenosine(37)-N6)-threonylcarbamoyltransferase complex dimerization subunit type 1 TsaB [Cyclobacteriaceae bacterium]
MAIILSLETSTTVCSVALHDDEKLIATAELHREQAHAAKLAILIDELVSIADIALTEVNAIAISSGPGSFTGLRIGVSTAKGLCYALSVPLIAVNTLELLAAQLNKTNITRAWLCPMIDARRMEVYCRLSDAEKNVLQGVEAKIIDEKSFEKELNANRIIFFGNGAEKCEAVIRHDNAVFVHGIRPSAASMGTIACAKFHDDDFEDIITFEPFYLKAFRVKTAAAKSVLPNKIA